MTHHCPQCERAIVKPGAWFKTVWRVKCEGCNGQMRFTYQDKLAIFEKHSA
jgi:hypothetical protein